MMTEFHSKWMDWKSSKPPTCSTDKTDKSPSVSFVSSTVGGFGQKTDHVREIGFLSVPYPDEPDTDDPVEGRRIIEAVVSVGGWMAIEGGRIVLRWLGDPPGIPELIDRIRGNRIGVVKALHQ